MLITKKRAKKLYHNSILEDLNKNELLFLFQLTNERLCIPFNKFHEITEKVLNRPVFSHEFADPEHLIEEFISNKMRVGE
jgi:hypothetical protein